MIRLNFLIIFLCSFTFVNDVKLNIPVKNKDFSNFVEKNGKRIAPTYKSVNCVQFMDKLLIEYLKIPKSVSDKIYIKKDISEVERLLKNSDTAIVSGVCSALVKGGYAKWVNPENIKRGDIIQYWSTDGFINGHCGIIYDEDKDGYILQGSHPDCKGFGLMNALNKHMKMKIFVVRLK